MGRASSTKRNQRRAGTRTASRSEYLLDRYAWAELGYLTTVHGIERGVAAQAIVSGIQAVLAEGGAVSTAEHLVVNPELLKAAPAPLDAAA